MVRCTVCGAEVTGKNFCSNCGAPAQPAIGASAPLICERCGRQSDPGARFCNHCGDPFGPPAPPAYQPGNAYGHTNYPAAPPPPQPAYPPAPQPHYGQPVPPQPQMVLRCPVCQAISALGSQYCANCHNSLQGIPPTPVQTPGQVGEIHIHHHHGQPAPYGYPPHGYPQHGYPRRYGDSGPLDGWGGALAAGAGGLLGGLVLGEVAEEIFDDD
ncbi:MAG: zinc ribbon domain-containing protein [Ktedonobacteraceae bacterium]|nr:zinc ribbon domain-containing protein [Ktedonobacteraceae bacterium]